MAATITTPPIVRVARGDADPDGTVDGALGQALGIVCGDVLILLPA